MKVTILVIFRLQFTPTLLCGHHPYSEHSSGDWAEWSSTGTTTERRQKRHADGVEPVQVQQALVSATLLGAPWSVLEPMSPE